MVAQGNKILEKYWGIPVGNMDLPINIHQLVQDQVNGRLISHADLYHELKNGLTDDERKQILLLMLKPELGNLDDWSLEELEILLDSNHQPLDLNPGLCITANGPTNESIANELERFGLDPSLGSKISKDALEKYCQGNRTLTNFIHCLVVSAKTREERDTADLLVGQWLRNHLAFRGHNFEFLGTDKQGAIVCWPEPTVIEWKGQVSGYLKVPLGQKFTFNLHKDTLVVVDANGKPISKPLVGKKINIQTDVPGIHRFGSTTKDLTLTIEAVDPSCLGIDIPKLPGYEYQIGFLEDCKQWIIADQRLKQIESQVLHGDPLDNRCNIIHDQPLILLQGEFENPKQLVLRSAREASESLESLEERSLSEAISEHLENKVIGAITDPLALQSFKVWHAISGVESLEMLLDSFDNYQLSESKLVEQISSRLANPEVRAKFLAMLRTQFA